MRLRLLSLSASALPLLLLAGRAAAVRLGATREVSWPRDRPFSSKHRDNPQRSHSKEVSVPEKSSTSKHTDEKKSSTNKHTDGWSGPLWLFAAHHKAGTNLLYALAHIQARALGLSVCSGSCGFSVIFGAPCRVTLNSVSERTMFSCNAGVGDFENARVIAQNNLRAVQIIRDPVEMVVSGYVYDMHFNDGFHADRAMRRMDPEEGMEVEAKFLLKEVIPGMVSVYQENAGRSDTLVLRMEDFTRSSESFDKTVERLYNFTMGSFSGRDLLTKLCSEAMREDLHRHPEAGQGGVSSLRLKDKAKQSLPNIPAPLLRTLYQYRKELGYHSS